MTKKELLKKIESVRDLVVDERFTRSHRLSEARDALTFIVVDLDKQLNKDAWEKWS